uniref:Kazal-like domain-containing protein n=1 Tax=Timema douglasi TaxID=61478 RepID=A0A7R8VR77_TIMDO|nr:unnamed protein product [Timema douglasi]
MLGYERYSVLSMDIGDTYTVSFCHQVHPTEIRTSISPSSAVELNTTRALANYATEAVFDSVAKSKHRIINSDAYNVVVAAMSVSDSVAKSKRYPRRCKTDCPVDYKPVCAAEGSNPPIRFVNKCELRAYSCLNDVELQVINIHYCDKNLSKLDKSIGLYEARGKN